MENITLDSLQTTILVILGIMGILVSIDKGIEAYKRLFRQKNEAHEKEQDRQIHACEVRIAACEQRINQSETNYQCIEEDNRQMLIVLNAMLMHMISGNDHIKLTSVKQTLDQYLANRR